MLMALRIKSELEKNGETEINVLFRRCTETYRNAPDFVYSLIGMRNRGAVVMRRDGPDVYYDLARKRA